LEKRLDLKTIHHCEAEMKSANQLKVIQQCRKVLSKDRADLERKLEPGLQGNIRR